MEVDEAIEKEPVLEPKRLVDLIDERIAKEMKDLSKKDKGAQEIPSGVTRNKRVRRIYQFG